MFFKNWSIFQPLLFRPAFTYWKQNILFVFFFFGEGKQTNKKI